MTVAEAIKEIKSYSLSGIRQGDTPPTGIMVHYKSLLVILEAAERQAQEGR